MSAPPPPSIRAGGSTAARVSRVQQIVRHRIAVRSGGLGVHQRYRGRDRQADDDHSKNDQKKLLLSHGLVFALLAKTPESAERTPARLWFVLVGRRDVYFSAVGHTFMTTFTGAVPSLPVSVPRPWIWTVVADPAR